MESNLIRALFQKLLDALRIKGSVSASAGSLSRESIKTEDFTALIDGITIHGRVYFPSTHPSKQYPVLVICHGIPGSGAPRPQSDPGYEGLAEEIASLGIAAVIFNFRGCGSSGGDFSMMGWTRDLEAVIDKILNTPHIDPTRLMLLGFSGGGAAAIYVAADNGSVYSLAVAGTPANFKIFERDPESIVTDFRERGIIRDPGFPPDLGKWVQEFEEIEPLRWISHFQGKFLLVLHGDSDELIPVEHARELYDRAPAGLSELEIIPGPVHRLRLDPRCIERLKRWMCETLGWRYP